MPVRVVVEHGPKDKRSVAFALDWPGWCRGSKTADDALAMYRGAWTLIIGTIVLALITGLGIAFWLARSIADSVSKVAGVAQQIAGRDLPSFVRVAKALAAGDLTQEATITAARVQVSSKDELGAMAGSSSFMFTTGTGE